METKIRIILAEDHILVRQGLRALLENSSDFEVVAEANNGREAVQKTIRHRPDIVVMDYSMPELNGLEATRQISSRAPDTKVLILTRHTNKEYLDSILEAGASGYLVKKSAAEELVRAIYAIQEGNKYLDPRISDIIVNGYLHQKDREIKDERELLSPRQREVLQLIVEGHPNREIASLLHISVKTVENHRAKILQTLELHSTAELVQYAIRNGIIQIDH